VVVRLLRTDRWVAFGRAGVEPGVEKGAEMLEGAGKGELTADNSKAE
jgi:hypothetical protein